MYSVQTGSGAHEPSYPVTSKWFETLRGKLIFTIYLILPAAVGPRVYSASNRNEYQKHNNINVSGE
jgi:hypothetical protein